MKKPKKIKLSASSIGLFLSCPRSYYHRYIDKIATPATPALRAGISFHNLIEDILTETTFRENYSDYMIETIVDSFENGVLGAHSDNFDVERKISIPINDDFEMTGKIDLVDYENHVIQDHKSVGHWGFVETSESLKKNLQLLIYGYWYIKEFDTDGISFRHNQICKTSGKNSKYVETYVSKEEVFEFWEKKVLVACKFIKKTREKESADTVKTKDSCSKYSGCHFRNCGACEGHEDTKVKDRIKKLSKSK